MIDNMKDEDDDIHFRFRNDNSLGSSKSLIFYCNCNYSVILHYRSRKSNDNWIVYIQNMSQWFINKMLKENKTWCYSENPKIITWFVNSSHIDLNEYNNSNNNKSDQ